MKKTKRLPNWGADRPLHLRPTTLTIFINMFGWGRQSPSFNAALSEVSMEADRRDANWMYCRMRRRARAPKVAVIK